VKRRENEEGKSRKSRNTPQNHLLSFHARHKRQWIFWPSKQHKFVDPPPMQTRGGRKSLFISSAIAIVVDCGHIRQQTNPQASSYLYVVIESFLSGKNLAVSPFASPSIRTQQWIQ
jgi:hypothetical protein